MSWTVEWSPRARKDMRRIDGQNARRVGRGIDRFAETGEGDIERLTDVTPVLQILRVLPRGDAYR